MRVLELGLGVSSSSSRSMAAASERFPGACVGIAVHSWASDIDCQGQFVLVKKGWSETRETSDGNRMRLSTRFSVLNRWP